MKKPAVIFVTLLIAFLIPARSVFAQGAGEVQKARQDYLYQYSNYVSAHGKYVTAADTFHKFGTIKSQQDAINATKEVLVARSEATRTYLELLKVILSNLEHMDPSLRGSQFGKIEATQAFLTTHKQNLEKVQSIAEINAESARYERESQSIENLSFETLSIVLIGNLQELEAEARGLLETIQSSNPPDTQPVQQGISQINNKLSSERLIIDQATASVNDYQTNRRKKAEEMYRGLTKLSEDGKKTLREIGQLLNELQELLK